MQRKPGCVELASSCKPQLFHFVTELQEGWVEFVGGKESESSQVVVGMWGGDPLLVVGDTSKGT